MKLKETEQIENIKSIIKLREENEGSEIICIREINNNINRVMTNQPLTRPLRVLNKSCEFKKRYNAYCDIVEGDLKKAKRREYHQKYYQKPEVKAKQREYNQKYYQKPEVKAKQREYNKIKYRIKFNVPKTRWRVR